MKWIGVDVSVAARVSPLNLDYSLIVRARQLPDSHNSSQFTED